MKNKEILNFIDNASILLLGILCIALPFVFLSLTTDAFIIPKQLLLAIVSLVTFFLFGARMVVEGKVKIRRTPFDLPVLLFMIATCISAFLSLNRADALIAYVPLFLSLLLYFVIINTLRNQQSIIFLLGCLVGGACLAAVVAVLSYLKFYILPFQFTHIPGFTTMGSLLDLSIYLAIVLPIAGYIAYPVIGNLSKGKAVKGQEIGFGVGFIIVLVGLAVSLIELFTTQKPVTLPFETGFQTAFAAISQDAGRTMQGFLFGSGFGTYVTDFTRFKQPAFNLNHAIWSFTFFRSSSFVLELLATSGLAGLLTFLFLIYRLLKERPLFIPLLFAILAVFILPFSFVLQTLFFLLVALYAAIQGSLGKHSHNRYFEVEMHLVAFKKGIISLEPAEKGTPDNDMAKFLPYGFCLISLLLTGLIGFYSIRYFISDMTFRDSLIAASQNNGSKTYTQQVKTIGLFPWRDVYYQSFAQVNLALANSIASAQPQGKQVDPQTQQTIITLIQQSINGARQATTVAPLNAFNWQNLSSIYRNLIGFGQNADQFAILTSQQAVALDSANPQEYINLGGIYYQLGQYDNAQRQFQIAVSLKPDFANAYYNLGHALEQKGDLQGALAQYQAVKQLIAADPNNAKKMQAEIDALQAKIGKANAEAQNTQAPKEASGNQPPLGISSPSTNLPTQQPPVKIPSPAATVGPSPTTTSGASKTPAVTSPTPSK